MGIFPGFRLDFDRGVILIIVLIIAWMNRAPINGNRDGLKSNLEILLSNISSALAVGRRG